ncbi:MAG: hypothetical protein PVI21_00900 [Candidatus Woesebacteria bacterium]|jgi:retron-type reverse transcriptase
MTKQMSESMHLQRAERASSLFDQVASFENLYAAYQAAARGKHDRVATLRHDLHAEKILWRLRWELLNGRYRHGKYRRFTIVEPKARDVSAAPFTDRIVHHAVVQVVEPLFERGFIYDSYACRRRKGTHQAALRLQHFLRSASTSIGHTGRLYVLRADIRKFFARIDHDVLKDILRRKLPDARLRELLGLIIDSFSEIVPQTPQAESSLSI